jgi:DNA ligase 1
MSDLLQLAHKYKTGTDVTNWYVSEKLDGMRAWWDGGVTRGMYADEVPWSNTTKDKYRTFSTGLWSRQGKVIYAPDWWVDELPQVSLDGELWLGRGSFQRLMSIVRRSVNIRETEWAEVRYSVFDSPAIGAIPGFDRRLARIKHGIPYSLGDNYATILEELASALSGSRIAGLVEQRRLGSDWYGELNEFFGLVLGGGGEGLMLRHPSILWKPGRRRHLLKMKGVLDAEGTVVGYKAGRGKHEGRMGALTVHWGGKVFDISGFTDSEREMDIGDAEPGGLVLGVHPLFKIGDVVTFVYRELTDGGIPKEARYLRSY